MVRRLTRDEMVQMVDNVLRPKGRGFTSQEINDQLLLFCANCPDPATAMDIVIETRGPVTASQLVERALACPPRKAADLPESELALTHPLRTMVVDP
jgi:hypothetical protein